jgi:hypothetical protein
MSEERDQEQNQKNHKQHLRNTGSRNRHAGKAQDRSDQRHHQERYCPVEHDNPPIDYWDILASTHNRTNPLEAVGCDRESGK